MLPVLRVLLEQMKEKCFREGHLHRQDDWEDDRIKELVAEKFHESTPNDGALLANEDFLSIPTLSYFIIKHEQSASDD
jgi:hypothetical protein